MKIRWAMGYVFLESGAQLWTDISPTIYLG